MREVIPVFHADPVLKRLGLKSTDEARKMVAKFGRVKSPVERDIDEQIEKSRKERENGN